MRMHWIIRVATSVPLAARVLVLGIAATGGLTVVAAAREAVDVPVLAEARLAEVTPEAPAPVGPPRVMRVPDPIPWPWLRSGIGGGYLVSNEGAIPTPATEPPPAEGAETVQGSRFALPLRAWTAVTDRFGAPRGPGFVHGGIDLALDGYPASPVYSACTGTVRAAAYSSTYGYYVVVDCGDGFTTLYAHFSRILVVVGQPVDNDTVLGISGSTGFSTGEHLHFEIHWNGVHVNPEDYLDFGIPPGTPLSTSPIQWRPTPTPTPTPTPVPSPSPSPTVTPAPSPTLSPTATASPSPSPAATQSPSPTATQSPAPAGTATPTPTATETSTPAKKTVPPQHRGRGAPTQEAESTAGTPPVAAEEE